MSSVSARTLIVVASGFGLSKALVESGASKALARGVVVMFGGGDFPLLLLGFFLVTALLSNVISPTACVTLMFPIAFEIRAAQAEHHVEPVLGILMIAGSCSLISPYSYQTNLMVTETAGYRPIDFLKFGGRLCAVRWVADGRVDG